MVKVIILGGGNVAYHLTNNMLKNKAIKVVQVYNRSIEKLNYLITLNCSFGIFCLIILLGVGRSKLL